MEKGRITCRACGGGNVQRAQMIWELGTGTQMTAGAAVGGHFNAQGGFSPSVHSIRTETQTRTRLAERYAPPITDRAAKSREHRMYAIVALIIGSPIALITWNSIATNPGYNPGRGLLCLIGMGLALAGLVGVIWKSIQLPAEEELDAADRKRQPQWEQTWACLSCGNEWVQEKQT